jgi:hypothetical protein
MRNRKSASKVGRTLLVQNCLRMITAMMNTIREEDWKKSCGSPRFNNTYIPRALKSAGDEQKEMRN